MPNQMAGYIKAEPDNPHDPNAIGVYNNEFGLVGYIPKTDTDFVRAWMHSDSPCAECKIYLSVEPEWDRYFGSVYIIDSTDETYYDNPFKDKSVYLCKNGFSLFGACDVIKSFGVKINDRLNKATDIVLYDNELTDTVKNKIGNQDYHFSTMSLTEFIQQAIPTEKRIPDIYGHVVTPSSVCDSVVDDYLRNYILISGGIYRKTYNKRETQTVIVKSDRAELTVAKATNDGKKIIQSRDLLPELYVLFNGEERDEKTKTRSAKENAQPKEIACEIADSDFYPIKQVQEPAKVSEQAKPEENTNGCIWGILILIAIIIYLIAS